MKSTTRFTTNMTPITQHEGKKVVRNSSKEPTPFLVSLEPQLDAICRETMLRNQQPRAVDLGAGSGRNSEWLKNRRFWRVISFDLKPDYGVALDLSRQDIPVFDGTVNLVLLNYVLMFLTEMSIEKVFGKTLTMCDSTGMIVVEMAAVKNSLYDEKKLASFLDTFQNLGKMCLFHQQIRQGLKLAMWRL